MINPLIPLPLEMGASNALRAYLRRVVRMGGIIVMNIACLLVFLVAYQVTAFSLVISSLLLIVWIINVGGLRTQSRRDVLGTFTRRVRESESARRWAMCLPRTMDAKFSQRMLMFRISELSFDKSISFYRILYDELKVGLRSGLYFSVPSYSILTIVSTLLSLLR